MTVNIRPPDRLSFRVWCEESTLRVDIENMHSVGVQGGIAQYRIDTILRPLMRCQAGAKSEYQGLALLAQWAHRLQSTGFVAVEYVGEGRWRWEGAVIE